MNTENTKFYNVKVGTRARSGNLNVLQSFVAQSNRSISDVITYYLNKYKGFDILVEDIREIVIDDIPKVESLDYLGRDKKDIEIDKLRSQLTSISQSKMLTKFEGKIRVDRINSEFYNGLKQLKSDYGDWKERKNILLKSVPPIIVQKYSNIVSSVNLDDFDIYDDYIKFTANVDGKLYSANNEL